MAALPAISKFSQYLLTYALKVLESSHKNSKIIKTAILIKKYLAVQKCLHSE